MDTQIKSKERVAAHGEVFTNPREVNAMLDLVKPETERLDSRFLEPACGDGNFLEYVPLVQPESKEWESVGVGDTIYHKSLGAGVVMSKDEKYLFVKFSLRESKFLYPDAFEKGYLSLRESL